MSFSVLVSRANFGTGISLKLRAVVQNLIYFEKKESADHNGVTVSILLLISSVGIISMYFKAQNRKSHHNNSMKYVKQMHHFIVLNLLKVMFFALKSGFGVVKSQLFVSHCT